MHHYMLRGVGAPPIAARTPLRIACCTPRTGVAVRREANTANMAGVTVDAAKELICELCRLFYDQGWVSGTGGGISVKAGEDRIVMAPSGVQKERMQPSDMYVLDARGEVVEAPQARPPPYPAPKLSECSPLFMAVRGTRRDLVLVALGRAAARGPHWRRAPRRGFSKACKGRAQHGVMPRAAGSALGGSRACSAWQPSADAYVRPSSQRRHAPLAPRPAATALRRPRTPGASSRTPLQRVRLPPPHISPAGVRAARRGRGDAQPLAQRGDGDDAGPPGQRVHCDAPGDDQGAARCRLCRLLCRPCMFFVCIELVRRTGGRARNESHRHTPGGDQGAARGSR